MKMFHKNIVHLVTGQKAIEVMTLNWITAVIQIAAALYSGYAASKSSKKGGAANRDAAYGNASDLREFAGINAGLLLGAANRNAQAQLTIGEANASSVERSTLRNMILYGMQSEEETRRHIYGERMSAGRIRSMVGASGVQTNTGTPLMFLYEQVDEGIRQRSYMETRQAQTLWTMSEEGRDRAGIMRLTASENAAVIMSNAEAQAEVSILDAQRQADAMERGGDVANTIGKAQGNAALIGGITSAIGSFASSGAFGGSYGGGNIGGTVGGGIGAGTGGSFTTNWASAGGWTNSTSFSGLNPYPSYGQTLSTSSISTGWTT